MTDDRLTAVPSMDRRRFLRYAGAGLAALAAGSVVTTLSGCHLPEAIGAVSTEPRPSGETKQDVTPDTEINLRAIRDSVTILPGSATDVWRYVAEVVEGSESAVQTLEGSYLGPILRFTRGERVRINFTNDLEEPTIVHWHGLHMPEDADGHPRLAIGPSESYTYDFTVMDRAGTYWYHPHPHGRTGPQVNQGLAGLLLVTDPEESALALPDAEADVPLVIQDRTFTSNNQFAYLNQGMHGRMMGFLGDQILVNGRPDFVLPVKTQAYRLRLLNGSNSRIYKLGWEDETPITVIGTDGGLLARPVTRPYVTLAPGERVELWVDFSEAILGEERILASLPYPGSQMFPVMRVAVEAEGNASYQLPERLTSITWYDERDAVNRRRPRTFEIDMQRMTWLLNGRTFDMKDVARDEIVRLDELEIWEFVNESPRMAMAHPMHVHNIQFQVIARDVLPQAVEQHATLAGGFVDEGWQDTVLVMPGERVKVLLKFEHYEGLYLYHCHNLEHEDMGMMRNFRIRA